ncbi:SMP-30/gluconolactonase/LRE family protein [Telmatobacter bradus]|uniref:SMP-30/gluconolactonase/LRE family protein n=1 Tax=Telmatobacter bradus TaxID=474953 RepID=UPI003B42C0A0
MMAENKDNPETTAAPAPRIDDVWPAAAMVGGEVELKGASLGPNDVGPPEVLVDGKGAHVTMSRASRLAFRVPEAAETGLVLVHGQGGASNAVPLRVARMLSDGLHPVTSPAVGPSGNVYATISGSRGKLTPVSVVRVSPGGQGATFVEGILNATGLAFSPEGELYVTSRAEGTVYRVDAGGEYETYVEGMGTATGACFDADGNLYVGDRSGTVFKIDSKRQIFVHATLPPSPAAYHMAVNAQGTLFVTAPSLSSNESIWAVEPNGDAYAWFRGLGRPQGLALADDGSVYVAACLHGRRGLVRISPQHEAELVLAGNNLVGVAFSPLGTTILSTSEAVYAVDLGVEGLRLF